MTKSRIWIRYNSKLWKQFSNKKNKKALGFSDDFKQKNLPKPFVDKDGKTWWVQI